MFQVATFYHFTSLEDLPALRDSIEDAALQASVCGTFLIAPEGVNATLASDDHAAFQDFIAGIVTKFGIHAHNLKWSEAAEKPFGRLKVRLKKETITMKRPEANAALRTGVHVSAAEWNDLIAQDDVLLLDTRNTYETDFGVFAGAVDPRIETFSEFADYVDGLDPAKTPKVAMYCTGGIRCEKASSYMYARGFKEVYQLQGGILKYLETIPADQSKWQGTCFVFDERVTLGHGLTTHKQTRRV